MLVVILPSVARSLDFLRAVKPGETGGKGGKGGSFRSQQTFLCMYIHVDRVPRRLKCSTAVLNYIE